MTGAVEYSHAKHIASVQRFARASGVKGAAFGVLSYMCSVANFKKPSVRVSKETICLRTGYHWDTVRLAIRSLKALGLIEPIAYETGGRGCATIYKIKTIQQYGAENPPSKAEMSKGGGFSVQKGAENPVKRGRKIHPPSKVYSDISSEVRGATYGGGGERNPLDENEKQELSIFSRDCREHGYGTARALQDKRRAAAAGVDLL